MSLPQVIVIAGPTGSGKSELALQVCEQLGGEIINADSVSIYKEFDIGSAKPSGGELARVPHHLVSYLSPDQNCSAGAFAELASQAIAEISGRGKLPVVVGGTGLYLRALLSGLRDYGPGDSAAIERLREREAELQGDDLAVGLHAWLASLDQAAAAIIHPHHLSRIRRAIVVALSTGRSFGDRNEREQPLLAMRSQVFWLHPERRELYAAIERRVTTMLQRGLVEEVEGIVSRWGRDISPLRSIGYAQVLALPVATRNETLHESIAQATRRFAKRQLTWWRNEPAKLGWQVRSPEPACQRLGLAEKIIKESQAFLENTGSKAIGGANSGSIFCSEVVIS